LFKLRRVIVQKSKEREVEKMRKQRMGLLLLFVLGCGALLMVNRYAMAKPSPAEETKRKWEYCHVYTSYPTPDNKYKAQVMFPSTPEGRIDEIDSNFGGLAALNKLGAEGWEIVGIISTQPNAEYILKRPKP
jgi:hypothetical protein